MLFLITCDIIFLHKIRQFDSFKFCWVFFNQITMAYSLCKLKICIYVYTVDINFIFVYCYSRTVFLVLTDCFGVHWSIEKFARTDDKFFWLFRHLFSLHNNNVIVRKRSINRWCYMVWCPLPFQYVWTTKESVLWMTCIKRYSKCNFNLPTNTAL